ncbi:hypothetical protein [Amycolatopsis sacchari]|uniref:Argininosuccinate lyase n=2 Tax=Amycolatopsis TaxID=1813 RepID=A0A1I4C503_9PSEU|nr:argininosuccinate lyase [Amycolatopsis sacchari]
MTGHLLELAAAARRLAARSADWPLPAYAATGEEVTVTEYLEARAREAAHTAELSVLVAAVHEFAADLDAWTKAGYGFADLPDEFAAPSPALPGKRYYPALGRVRRLSADLGTDATTAYRNTAEALHLLTGLLDHLRLHPDRLREATERQTTLALRLTSLEGIPRREARLIAADYLTAAAARCLPPAATVPALLAEAAAARGRSITDPRRALRGLAAAGSPGTGANPVGGDEHPPGRGPIPPPAQPGPARDPSLPSGPLPAC